MKPGIVAAFAASLLLTGCEAASTDAASAMLPGCARPQAVADYMYLVFFDHHSSALTPRARTIIREFTERMSIYDDLRIRVIVSNDTSEVAARDHGLAQRRGDAVAMGLRENGLFGNAVIRIARTGLLVPTPPNVAEPQNRFATLLVIGARQARPTARQAECRDWLATHRCDADPGLAATCAKVRSVADEFKPRTS